MATKMSELEVEELYRRKEAGDYEARELLIERNVPLIKHIANKYSEAFNIDFGDCFGAGALGLVKAVDRFDIKQGAAKFPGYIAISIANGILMELRKKRKYEKDISFDTPIAESKYGDNLTVGETLGTDPEELLEDIMASEKKRIVREAIAKLTTMEQELLWLRFGLDGKTVYTQKQTAIILQMSLCMERKHEIRALIKLRHPEITKQLRDFIDI